MMSLLPLLQFTLFLDKGGLAPGFEQSLLLGFFKFFLVLGALLYTFFAFIVIRQVAIMRATLITEFSPLFTILGYIHFVGAVMVVFFFLVTL